MPLFVRGKAERSSSSVCRDVNGCCARTLIGHRAQNLIVPALTTLSYPVEFWTLEVSSLTATPCFPDSVHRPAVCAYGTQLPDMDVTPLAIQLSKADGGPTLSLPNQPSIHENTFHSDI
ncbi:hypothetical protein VTI28DRAFT_9366 [Corynascus sepedonium]